ncbi:MAG: nuclear transport factor 2 family protein [Ilumatobacteraceae bacterium]|jgi:3-phenylpropionate/cinnamic acid dioxygenase small subunit|nr:nuclear transport factor 2 family protein [Actinomycetota bacterium]MDA3012114.1 nuclear transport factor 2 family protein [Actinomycetota bacterium]MDA3024837.1 nuclear transport factor 2 family protein [Actinomycetota bacterium]NBU55594.1 nuclear transport factor 2 family protein [Acidimicrobiia bacterium]
MLTSGDEREIVNLLFAYAEAVDGGRFDDVSALFESAEVFMGGPERPSMPGSHVGSMMEKMVMLYDGVPNTKHVVTNTIIEADDHEHASTRSYFTVSQCVPGEFPLQVVASGRYHDRFLRTDAGWRFAERIVHFDHRGDTSFHLRSGRKDGS